MTWPPLPADMTIEHVPASFPEKGRFRTWDAVWNPTGFADEPQYRGQLSVNFPLDWTTAECFLGFRVRP